MSVNNKGTWPYRVEKGDILVDAKGTERVVREARQGKDGYTNNVTLAILRCSWTKRCYTVLNYADLKYRGFEPTGKKYAFALEIDTRIEEEIARAAIPQITCCDIYGVR